MKGESACAVLLIQVPNKRAVYAILATMCGKADFRPKEQYKEEQQEVFADDDWALPDYGY